MNKKQLKKMYPYITREEIDYCVDNNSYKTERGFLNSLARKNSEYEKLATSPDVTHMSIKISWHKSRTWGYCPRAEVWATFANGEHTYLSGFSATGCGYDKESQVVSDVFNRLCRGMLYRRRHSHKKKPYGVYLDAFFPCFAGGIGMNAYAVIANFLGGRMEHVSWSSTFDHYVFNFKSQKPRA